MVLLCPQGATQATKCAPGSYSSASHGGASLRGRCEEGTGSKTKRGKACKPGRCSGPGVGAAHPERQRRCFAPRELTPTHRSTSGGLHVPVLSQSPLLCSSRPLGHNSPPPSQQRWHSTSFLDRQTSVF